MQQGIHIASNVKGKTVLAPGEHIIVEIPEDTVPFIKVWPQAVLLSHIGVGVLRDIEDEL
jgi:hypothetical protein